MARAAGNSLRRWIAFAGASWAIPATAALCILASAAFAQTTNTGGTGGIGGTGHAPGEGNGIGGTGAPQATITGISGTITGFGSIFVNDYEVDYAAATPAKSDLDDKLDTQSLSIGQVVEIEAEGEGKHVRARRIAGRYEVAGPIESIDRAAGTIQVLGQTVAPGSIENLSVGDTVRVSGLRRADQVIAASRVDRSEPSGQAWLRGRAGTSQDGSFTVGGVRMASSGFEPGSKPAAGEEMAVSGAYSQGMFTRAKVTRLPQVPFGGRTARLSIEGYVASRAGGGHSVGGLGLGAGAAGSYRPGDRVVAGGKFQSGRFVPTEVRPSRFRGTINGKKSEAHPSNGGRASPGRSPTGAWGDIHGRRHPAVRGGGTPPRLQGHRDAGGTRPAWQAPPQNGNKAKHGRNRRW